MITKIFIKNKSEMIDLANKIALESKVGDVIGLVGSLGVGKSFFAKNFINAISSRKLEVLSPTFNLVYSYDTKKGEVFHFDLYRLKSASELENIGFFESLQNGISLIEWPEIARDFLVKNYLEINIKNIDSNGDEAREIVIKNN